MVMPQGWMLRIQLDLHKSFIVYFKSRDLQNMTYLSDDYWEASEEHTLVLC